MNASVRQREAALRLALKKAREDLDFAVHVLDALEGIAYANDRQVVELAVRKHLDRKRPRMAIEVYTLEPVAA